MKFWGILNKLILKFASKESTKSHEPDADKYYTDFRRNMCAKTQTHPYTKPKKQLD